MSARIVTIDIETTRALVETFSLFSKYIHIDRVIMPSRILCFAAQWRGEERIIFHSAWDDDDDQAYRRLIESAWNLFDQADVVCTYNGDRFDIQWLNAEFARLGMTPPSPYRSLDLVKLNKKYFKQGLMSLKLDWSARRFLDDRKIPHEGPDLWHMIRYGNHRQKREACRDMRAYCEHDTRLTGQLMEHYLPWSNINLALYEDNDDGLLHCTKCNGTSLQRRGWRTSNAYRYRQYACNDCGSWSRGPNMVHTTELRPV